MKEIFLLKLGEIVLKGANKRQFENKLRQNVRRRMKKYGNFDVYILQSTVYVEPMDEEADVDGAWEACRSIFGVVSLCRCRPCAKDLDAIFDTAMAYLGDDLSMAKSFKVESRRSDKRFPLTSIGLSQEIGGRLAEAFPDVTVDVHHPDYTVYVEVRDRAAYVHGPAEPGAGGLPTGVGGRAMLLLSGGIDSPVACYLTMKRGSNVDFLAFHSAPYTPPETTDKIRRIAGYLNGFQQSGRLYLCNIAELQKAIRDNCNPRLRTVLYRRMMFRIGERIARRTRCLALLTGESLGQVASQTLVNMGTIGAATSLLVLRPLVGLDKLDSVRYAEAIGTFELSRQQVPDSCTVFAPDSPATAVPVDKALAEEAKLGDYPALLDKIVDAAECVVPD